MSVNLVPERPLSEVVFVHDYLQLGFQDARFNLYNTTRVSSSSGESLQGQLEFPATLVGLIGQRVQTERESSESVLELIFEGGTCLQVLRGSEHVRTPEAFE